MITPKCSKYFFSMSFSTHDKTRKGISIPYYPFTTDYIQLHTKVIIYQPNNFIQLSHLCPVIHLQIEI